MTLAAGVAKKLVVAKETTWGTPVAAGGTSKYLRRVESTIDLEKDNYQSNEVRSDFQMADFRHGVRRVRGSIRGELGLGSYDLFMAAALRKDFAAGGTYSGGDEITADADTKTFTRDDGSFITDGFRVGHIVRWSGLSAGNDGKNFRITALTATVMTVAETVEDVAVADTDATCATVGKVSFIPTTGHTWDSFTVEHNYSDIGVSEVFSGCSIGAMRLGLPATGLATVDFDVTGKDRVSVLSGVDAPYFSSPGGAGTGAVLAAVNGALRLGGSDIAVITGASIDLNLNIQGDPVVGSNSLPALFPGRSTVSGQLTAYFADDTFISAFDEETELELHLVCTDTASPAGFVSFFLPRIKLGGASKNDGEGGLIQTMPFTALLKPTATGYESTTLMIQDSSLSYGSGH